MKIIKFDLPINGIKVTSLEELHENLTAELNACAEKGQLERWLRSRQLNDEANAVQQALHEFNQSAEQVPLFLALCAAIGAAVHPDDAAALFNDPPPAGQHLFAFKEAQEEIVKLKTEINEYRQKNAVLVSEQTLNLQISPEHSVVLRAQTGLNQNRRVWLASEAIAGWEEPGPIYKDKHGLYAEFAVKGVVQRCRWIPPGTFLMGSPENEPERESNETQHTVTLSGYWLAETACTQALWQAVLGNNPSRIEADGIKPDKPVNQVDWYDSQEFLNRLNYLIPGLAAGLPSEAQWEYACRAGATTPFSFGENITPEQVNYNGNNPYANGSKGHYRSRSVVVASLPASPWGLYEMHGNVWECCSDWKGDYAATAQRNPEGPPSGSSRVLRGGSWDDFGRNARSAYRLGFVPGFRDYGIGLRVAPGRAGSAEPTASR